MVRNAAKFGFLGFLLAAGGCTEPDNGSGDGTSGGPSLGDDDSGSETTPPDEPAPTSASAGSTITTGDPPPDETTGGSTTDGGDEESSGDDDGSTSGGDELSCQAYCTLYMDACQDFSEFANAQHCLDHCEQWPLGAVEDTEADSLGCRTYHVTVASSTDPNVHCPHSGPSGELTCIDEDAPTCDLYCTRYFNNCTGDLNLWADMDACMGQCGLWYPGAVGDTTGHTTGCRAYYANLAAADAEGNCVAAGPGGGEQCVLGL